MTTFVSAALGLGLALLILGMAWIRENDMAHALYQAALVGGLTTALGGFWLRKMILAGHRTERARIAEAQARQDEGTKSGPATPTTAPGPNRNT